MSSTALLSIDNLAFDGTGPVSLSLAPGECVGLTGPSGSGKTRLLRAIADMEAHTGRLWLDGVASEAMPPWTWRRQVGLLPAESAWWFDTVGEHFAAPPAPDRLTALGFDAAVLAWQVDRLSSGEKQRLAVLRLLSVQPRVLLLDEPTANLDADNAAAMEALIAAYRRERQAAALWVGHDPAQLQRVAGTCWRLAGGRLSEVEAAA